MINLKLEAMKLAMQAALQYGAFSPNNLAFKETPEGIKDHNWGQHYQAMHSLADAIYEYISKDSSTPINHPPMDPALAEIHFLHQLRGIQKAWSDDTSEVDIRN